MHIKNALNTQTWQAKKSAGYLRGTWHIIMRFAIYCSG